ncbi:MAG TPA: sigma-70 family RNA polymerase sigma factor [Phnomibacter sp.]|nr:sigma-70 family RNA polymerase sigma factor [Phnomibacter sp.]
MAEYSNQFSDQQLLQLYSESGNNQYAGILLQRYTILLFGVCMKYLKNEEESKDAVQQVFIKALGEMGKYEISYFKSWLYTVARNHCLMALRKSNRVVPDDNIERYASSDGDPLDGKQRQQEREQTLGWLEEGLEQLQEPQKECVTLFYLQKRSYQDIAASTGISLMQVKSAIQNGKRNLRIWVEKQRKQHAS